MIRHDNNFQYIVSLRQALTAYHITTSVDKGILGQVVDKWMLSMLVILCNNCVYLDQWTYDHVINKKKHALSVVVLGCCFNKYLCGFVSRWFGSNLNSPDCLYSMRRTHCWQNWCMQDCTQSIYDQWIKSINSTFYITPC